MKQAIIVFTRIPVPGKTKTRMMPALSGKQCARLHTCFLRDIAGVCKKTDADLFVNYTGCDASPERSGKNLSPERSGKNVSPEGRRAEALVQIFGQEAGYFSQEGDTLGERMYNAIRTVLSKGYESCVLIGTDIPEIRPEHLRRAFEVLEETDLVFGRTMDGGYYLVGMKKPWKEAFGLETYGVSTVFADTLKKLETEKISVGYTATLQDMDTPEDLNACRRRMRTDESLKNTHTGRFLAAISRISIIIPLYNEETTIEQLQRQLWPLKDKCEIIFVDGESTDGTLEKLSSEFRLVRAKKSRAAQMNAGALASSGDILFFLHCDSELPAHPLEQIREVMRDYEAGCFGIAFHSRNFFMFTCRVISNHRVKDRKVMFGDQGIFIDRELFFEVGMFPEIPVMEDYQLSLTLKERRVRLGMTRKRICTSDRRFPPGTIPKLRLMWKMNRLRKMYRDQVPAETIAKLYRDVR